MTMASSLICAAGGAGRFVAGSAMTRSSSSCCATTAVVSRETTRRRHRAVGGTCGAVASASASSIRLVSVSCSATFSTSTILASTSAIVPPLHRSAVAPCGIVQAPSPPPSVTACGVASTATMATVTSLAGRQRACSSSFAAIASCVQPVDVCGARSVAGGWNARDLAATAVFLATTAAAGSFLIGPRVSTSSPFSEAMRRSGGSGGGGGGGGGGPSTQSTAAKKAAFEEQGKTRTGVEDTAFPESYEVSVRALRGGRLSMEDEYFIADGGRFCAVFDGHGGGGVSSLLRERLYDMIDENLREQKRQRSKGFAGAGGKSHGNAQMERNPGNDHEDMADDGVLKYGPSVASHVAALRAAFDRVDKEVLMDDVLQYQGSTAVAVVLHEGDDGHRTLVSANVGDSRAVLSRRGHAVDLTRDHKPNDEREKARILAMGEKIEWDHYCKVHRVRNLSLSRAIGDRFAKPAVSGEVEIKRFPVAEDGDEFILLASDGLWDVMTSQEAVSFVHRKLAVAPKGGGNLCDDDMERLKSTRRKNMSRFVANEALRRGSGDNICVVIVWLKDHPPSFS